MTFVESGRGIEAQQVTAAGYEFVALPCRPLPQRLGDILPSLVEIDRLPRRAALAGPRAVCGGRRAGRLCPAGTGPQAAIARRVPLLLLSKT